jgi:hypothetical protein
MAIQKYRTEFALNLYGNSSCLLQQSDLDKVEHLCSFTSENPCHIYMICERPRFTFEPAAFRVAGKSIAGEIKVQVKNDFLRYPFVMDNSPKYGSGLIVDCPYPYAVANLLLENGAKVVVKAAVLAAIYHALTDYLTLDVLYVGQSYGTDGARTAPDRLRNHATLQEIYAKSMEYSPDKDIWLLLWNFRSQWVACIDGTQQEVESTEAEDDVHTGKVLDKIIEDQLGNPCAGA